MYLLWTRSTLLGQSDDIITWGLEEPVSHFSVQVGDEVGHSSWDKGIDMMSLEDLLKTRKIIYSIHIPASEQECADFMNNINENIDKRYDFRFFFWLLWRVILKKFFRIPVPDEIKSEDSRAWLCTEIIDFIPESAKT